MRSELQGKTVFVTGAGVGIGFGLCQAFAKAGALVALNDIDEKLAAKFPCEDKVEWWTQTRLPDGSPARP